MPLTETSILKVKEIPLEVLRLRKTTKMTKVFLSLLHTILIIEYFSSNRVKLWQF